MKFWLITISLIFASSLVAAQQEVTQVSTLHRSLSDAASDTSKMEAYSDLGFFHLTEDRDSALFYFGKGLSIAVGLKLKYQEASLLNALGVIYMQQEKFSKSLEHYLQAINIMKDPGVEKTLLHLPQLRPHRIAECLYRELDG
jgi:tetratricopeptide (TPR) repeat protein